MDVNSLTTNEKAVAQAMLDWNEVKERGLFTETRKYRELEPISEAMAYFTAMVNQVQQASTPEESIELYLERYDDDYEGSNSLEGLIIKYLGVDMRKVASFCLSETLRRYTELTDSLLAKTKEALNGES